MRKSVLLVIGIFISINFSNAQNLTEHDQVLKKQQKVTFEPTFSVQQIDDLIWVEDSNYLYYGDYTNWLLDYKYIVLTRDDEGRVLTAQSEDGSYVTGLMEKAYLYRNIYDEDTLENYIDAWNSDTEEWVSHYHRKSVPGLGTIEYYSKGWYLTSNQYYGGNWYYYEYDEDKNLSLATNKKWDIENDLWINAYKYAYTYDENDQMIEMIIQDWDENESIWINMSRDIYTFINDTYPEAEISQIWNNATEVWENDFKYDFVYDENFNRLKQIAIGWNSYDDSWTDTTALYTSSYNNLNVLTSWLVQFYIDDKYENQTYHTFEYNYDGYRIKETRQNWEDNEWENNSTTHYTYDEFGNDVQWLKYQWITETEMWENDYRTVYTYLNNEILIGTEDSYWDIQHQTWNNSSLSESFWSQIEVLNIHENNQAQFNVFPNPSAGEIYIESTKPLRSNIKIFNINGQLVKETDSRSVLQKVDITDLPDGLYFIQAGNSIKMKKIVKQ